MSSSQFNPLLFNTGIFNATDYVQPVPEYVLPNNDAAQPLEGDALDDFLQSVIVGCIGIDGSKVRPRWQYDLPNLPPANESWVALGTTAIISDTNAAVVHEADEFDTLLRQQLITVLCSFYGPMADSYAGMLQDGLQIAQNRDALEAAGFAFISTGDALRMPSLVKEKWLMRIDVQVTFTRQMRRRYVTRNIESAPLVLDNEHERLFLDVEQQQ